MIEYLSRIIPNRVYLRLMYYKHFHKVLDFANLRTFNEKMQWLKLYDHQDKYIKMVDKIQMKKYISEVIGEGYTIPTIAIWDSVDKIEFDKLPNQFVLKTNHDSKGVMICRDKKIFNIDFAKDYLGKHLKNNGYYYGREWPYKNVERCVFAEEYIQNSEGELIDYKVHVFDGIPRLILVCQGRFSAEGMYEDFLTCTWEKTEIHRPNVKRFPGIIEKPYNLDEMLDISKKLSKDIPFLRVDFYSVDNRLYIGELTFYPASGFLPFKPEGTDEQLGEWVPIKKRG